MGEGSEDEVTSEVAEDEVETAPTPREMAQQSYEKAQRRMEATKNLAALKEMLEEMADAYDVETPDGSYSKDIRTALEVLREKGKKMSAQAFNEHQLAEKRLKELEYEEAENLKKSI